jgi:hypothetical protein
MAAGDRNDGSISGRVFWLVAGALAIAAGTAIGWDSTALASLIHPSVLVRAALVGTAVGLGVLLLVAALARLAAGSDEDRDSTDTTTPSSRDVADRDIGSMIRGVRFVFLAVAAFAAASGWLLGHPLPFVIALVIAGVDVLETSFLLIVVGLRQRR